MNDKAFVACFTLSSEIKKKKKKKEVGKISQISFLESIFKTIFFLEIVSDVLFEVYHISSFISISQRQSNGNCSIDRRND